MAAPDYAVNLTDALSRFDETWSPKIVAEANGWQVKVVKADGEHQPVATRCEMVLLEPAGVPNTGDVDSELAHDAEWL